MAITVNTDTGRRVGHGYTNFKAAVRRAVEVSKTVPKTPIHIVTGVGVTATYLNGKRVKPRKAWKTPRIDWL